MPPIPRHLHDWDLTPKAAVTLQRDLASQVRLKGRRRHFRTVAGCDVSYDRGSPVMWAAIVVVRVADLEPVESVVVSAKVKFPYVPGLLSFREAPVVLQAWESLRTTPDAVMLDAQGVAHPRRFGLACHVGLWLQVPSIGCAKTRLCGEFAGPGPHPGDTSPLCIQDEQVGVVLRSAARAKPVFVSPGHMIDLDGAVAVVLATLSRYRQPVPTRLAHLTANQARTTGAFVGDSPA